MASPPSCYSAAASDAGWMSRRLAALGRAVLSAGHDVRQVVRLATGAARYIVTRQVDWHEVVRQAYFIGNRSLLFIAVTIGFLGLISVYLVGTQLERILPEFSVVGPAYIQLMVREFGPALTGMMVATRVGTGIAAEIGSMVVTEQIDALLMCNANPVRFLVAPRLAASSIMILVLTVFAVAVAIVAGVLMGQLRFSIPPETFLNLALTETGDLITGLVKALCNGIAIPVISAFCGLQAQNGSQGVGRATTAAVVSSCLAVIVIDLVVGSLGFLFG